ncbi:hypothetical protein JVU11DRAFT_6453 [Chiua virens]|nr:hypothetical protein JVU11DRAFT_6453 [Chiua virens]
MFAAVRSTKKASQSAEQHKALRAQLEVEAFGDVSTPREGRLSAPEVWWSQHFNWLRDRGYLLRQRYSPDWSPSWLGTKKNILACEDGRVAKFASRLIDATRLSDSSYVVLKLLARTAIIVSQSMRHLHIPDDSETCIIVMPLLLDYRHPPFETMGEAGLQFMHKHRVAHRDCTSRNVMMDPTTFYLDAFHPVNP